MEHPMRVSVSAVPCSSTPPAYQSTQLADFTAWDKLRFVGHQAVLAGTASSDPVAVGMWNNDAVLTRVGSDGDADLIFADDFGDRALN
ncbi:MAG: hypothetical protein KF903_02510 [Dokdonella sp.]|uniref:hypothetical protein n=2 Tax=Dokdonella sp. TaxID=2291710 RepID=UPI0027B9455C|nr:hypothetical protein [Dokdonella sp.]MBX3699861.1 hypothetical protein [Dokdonella sp.]